MYTNTNTITPLLQLIQSGYKTNTGQRHLRRRYRFQFFLLRASIVLAAWAVLFTIIYLIFS